MPRLRPGERFGRTFYGRLLLGQLAVAVALLVTVGVVAGTVGPSLFHLHLVENGPLASAEDLVYADRAFTSALWVSLAVAVVVAAAVAVAIGLATVRPLRRQLRQLAEFAGEVAAGDYAQRVDAGSAGEEIDLLAASLNSMAAQLQDSEEARKRLLADLAHELRTPIASLAVTVEAVTDGVLEPDQPTLATLAEQTDRLTRLAGDLRDISDAEGGLAVHPLPCDVTDLLGKARAAAAEAYAAKGVRLEVEGGRVRGDSAGRCAAGRPGPGEPAVERAPAHPVRRAGATGRELRAGRRRPHRDGHRRRHRGGTPAVCLRAFLPHGHRPRPRCRRDGDRARHQFRDRPRTRRHPDGSEPWTRSGGDVHPDPAARLKP